jgi:hypothetical protein
MSETSLIWHQCRLRSTDATTKNSSKLTNVSDTADAVSTVSQTTLMPYQCISDNVGAVINIEAAVDVAMLLLL